MFRQMHPLQELFDTLSCILCFTIYISLCHNLKYTLLEVIVHHHHFFSSKAYQNCIRCLELLQGSQFLHHRLWIQKSWVQDPKSWVSSPRSWVAGSQAMGLGCWVLRSWVSGPRSQGPRVPGPGSQVLGPRSQVLCPRVLGSQVLGPHFRLCPGISDNLLNFLSNYLKEQKVKGST